MNTLHANFNGGLMTERLAGRFDLEKLRTGCVQLKNMIPTPFGGVFKRPGTRYLQDAETAKRIITFKRDSNTAFIVILGEEWMGFYGSNTGSRPAWATGTKYEAGDLVEESGLDYICTVSHTASASFATDSAKWYQQFAVNSLAYLETPWQEEELFQIQFAQINDVMFLVHPNHLPRRLVYRGSGRWNLEELPYQFAPALDLNKTRIAVQVQYDGIRKWADSWVTATAYVAGDIIQGTGATAGRIYECILAHTSAAADQPGVGANTATYWTQLATGYSVGDRVLGITSPYEGQLFTCNTAHGGATADAVDEPGVGSSWTSYWNLGTSSTLVNLWAVGTSYVVGNRVRQNAVIYECIANHSATAPKYNRYGNTGGNQPAVGAVWTAYWKISSAGTDLSGLEFKLVATEDLFTSNDVGTNWLLEIGTTGRYDSLSLSGAVGASSTEPLFIQGGYLVTTIWTTGSSYGGSLYVDESLDGVTWQKVKEWTMTDANDGNISYEGTAPDIGAWYRIGGVKSTARGNGQMKIEAVSAVLKLPFKIETYTSATSVKGKLITVNDQLPPAAAIGVSTTSYRKPAFSPNDGYPRAVCFHDGRLWLAGTSNYRSRIWASKLDDFYNFLTGSLDDSGLDVTLGATEANGVVWLASHNRALVVGTTGQEWTIDGGDAETVITPTKASARLRMRHGSSGLAPETIAESLLWITRSGAQLREFTYSFQIDGYTAPDMSQLLGGIWDGIKQTSYMSTPFPIIWMVDNVGTLWAMVYDREQNVVAWSKHTTGESAGDEFMSVAATPPDVASNAVTGDFTANCADNVYFLVKRTIGGVEKTYLEYFDSSALSFIFAHDDRSPAFGQNELPSVDSSIGLIYGGTSTLTNSGANCQIRLVLHLNGRVVQVRENGTNISPLSSTLGASGLQGTFSNFQASGVVGTNYIGLPFDAVMQAFPLEVALQDGTGQGRNWRPNRIVFLLRDSMGGKYGDAPSDAVYSITYPSDATYPFSGRIEEHISSDWRDATQVTIKHADPSPFGLLGYVLKGEISGS